MNLEYADAALANLNEAIASMRSAMSARTYQGTVSLLVRAQAMAINAREKLEEAMGRGTEEAAE